MKKNARQRRIAEQNLRAAVRAFVATLVEDDIIDELEAKVRAELARRFRS